MALRTLAAYRFKELVDLPELRQRVRAVCQELELLGTVLLAHEGINAFVAGQDESVQAFRDFLVSEFDVRAKDIKINPCQEPPFRRLLVKRKKEIISLGVPGLQPDQQTGSYLRPTELRSWLRAGKDFVLLDTRNAYEIEAGTFQGAQHLSVDSFREFGARLEELPQEFKAKPVVTFCTGGIRCEKATALMMRQGFSQVYQLEGGILRYFEECGGEGFRGSCFVFDWRMAVDPELRPVPRSEDLSRSHGRHRMIANREGE